MNNMRNERLIDLHTHTNYSYGDLSPQELIRLAIDKNIGIMFITGHDTIEGIKQVDRTDYLFVQITKNSQILSS